MDQSRALESKLGYADKQKLDQPIQKIGPACGAVAQPPSNPGFQDQLQIMADLMVLALQCDATRVITFMLGNAGSNRVYNFLGINEGHHTISHRQGDAGKQAQLQTIDTWEVEQLAYLLQRMDEVQEGTGTLLKHSQVFFSSEIEDGNSHAYRNLPVILAGSAMARIELGDTSTTSRRSRIYS